MVLITRLALHLLHLSLFRSCGARRCSNLLPSPSCTKRTLSWMSAWRSFPPILLSPGLPHLNYGQSRQLNRVQISHMFWHSRLNCKRLWALLLRVQHAGLIIAHIYSRMLLALTSWRTTLTLVDASCGVALQMPLTHRSSVISSSSKLSRRSLKTHLYL